MQVECGHWNPARAIRRFVGGASLIGGGLKAIVG